MNRPRRAPDTADAGRVNRPRIPIAIFLTSFDPGGTERQMTELIRRLDPARFDVHVACFHKSGAWLTRVEPHARSIAEFPITGFFKASTLKTVGSFARWCRSRRIVVLQTCDYYSNVIGQLGGALARVPVRLASRRDINPGRSSQQLALQRTAYRLAHHVIANSPAARNAAIDDRVASKRTTVIPNGVDVAAFGERSAARPIRNIITVANLRPEKQHDVLLDAAGRLTRAGCDLHFHIVGGGPLRPVLEFHAAARGLSDRVTFHGHRDDVPSMLAAADLYVLPSRTEALPNGVLEAMAAGLPVVAFAVEGLLDLVDNGRTGVLVTPGDAEALARGIKTLVEQPREAHLIGRNARAAILAHYSFEAMVAQFEQLYEREAARVMRGGPLPDLEPARPPL